MAFANTPGGNPPREEGAREGAMATATHPVLGGIVGQTRSAFEFLMSPLPVERKWLKWEAQAGMAREQKLKRSNSGDAALVSLSLGWGTVRAGLF